MSMQETGESDSAPRETDTPMVPVTQTLSSSASGPSRYESEDQHALPEKGSDDHGADSHDHDGPGGPGGPGRPKLDKYAYTFWSKEIAPLRKVTFKILGGTVFITMIVMWCCLPLYWGSLWKSNTFTHHLTVRVIDRDGGAIGQAVTEGLLRYRTLNFFTSPAADFPTDADVAHDVVQEGVWAAIVISQGSTALLEQARSTGNSSFNGSEAIHVYYAQARQENAVGSYLLPLIQSALGQITAQYSAQSVARYLQANAGNQTAIAALAQAPTTVSNAVFYTLRNLRPYNQPVATAITLVGSIYLVIFSLTITMANHAARQVIEPYLTTRSYLIYRIAMPMTLYVPISFLFAMVSLPFKVHFGAHFTYAGGFFLWAFACYVAMAGLGLAIEFAITLLGPQFIAFFLLPWIIANASIAVMPHELQPTIFRYGAAMPFFNLGRIVRTIIFDTKNEIGKNLGILLAWVAVSFITITLATWLIRRKSVKSHQQEQVEKHSEGRI